MIGSKNFKDLENYEMNEILTTLIMSFFGKIENSLFNPGLIFGGIPWRMREWKLDLEKCVLPSEAFMAKHQFSCKIKQPTPLYPGIQIKRWQWNFL